MYIVLVLSHPNNWVPIGKAYNTLYEAEMLASHQWFRTKIRKIKVIQ